MRNFIAIFLNCGRTKFFLNVYFGKMKPVTIQRKPEKSIKNLKKQQKLYFGTIFPNIVRTRISLNMQFSPKWSQFYPLTTHKNTEKNSWSQI